MEQQQRIRARLQELASTLTRVDIDIVGRSSHAVIKFEPDIATNVRDNKHVHEQQRSKREVNERNVTVGRVRSRSTLDQAASVIEAAFRGMRVRKSLRNDKLVP